MCQISDKILNFNFLTKKRKIFLEQIYNLINNQFQKQEKINILDPEKIIKELENNPDYIQRIFIDASWGMGKTYFANAFQEKVEIENKFKEKKIELININAWETDYFSDPMKSLIGEINSSITLTPETTIKAEQILKNGSILFGKSIINKALEKIGIGEKQREEFYNLFKELTNFEVSELKDYENYKKLVNEFKSTLTTEETTPKIIIIDELDRCRPNYAIELLETIKHFFGVKNIIFVFLVNMEQLKSIASSSYLTEDKCSEYFEKFYDIKFSLPELDYEDFTNIEYNKYDQLETYNLVSNNGYYSSDEIDTFYESLFLLAFQSNCNSHNVAPRIFIKSFKKFTLLLYSLSEEEKGCYPLMIILILYFIREEFNLRDNKTNIKTPIELLFLRTFFIKNNSTLSDKILSEEEINSSDYFIKSRFLEEDFYKDFYLILLYKKTSNGDTYCASKDSYNYFLKFYNELIPNNKFCLNINTQYIIFEKINYFYIKGHYYDPSGIALPNKFIRFLSTNIYRLNSTNEPIYSTEILEKWAEEKHNFILNINN
ncbi:P-loop NTPase fold protein [Fusobacterium sp.]|uniref:KAP family P-loop NTPase fold protein n=1 Tax=Fusobacterium sp. TaxID=68766 RepID=UPI00261CCB4D|nr:P-loop NTPase fold protein [Fusobacterium sp.]